MGELFQTSPLLRPLSNGVPQFFNVENNKNAALRIGLLQRRRGMLRAAPEHA
jgi:hypothetical protein